MTTWVFINDSFVAAENAALSYRDLAIQRGYGVFDFFRVEQGYPVFLEDHLDRFHFSAEQMHLRISLQSDALREVIDILIRKNQMEQGGIRLTLTGGNSPDGFQPATPNLVISPHSFTPVTAEQLSTGIRLMTYAHQRQLPQVKSIDYLMAIWLQPLLREKQGDDILYHQDGWISECPRSNFFLVTGSETIVTPSSGILKGITRLKILEACGNHFTIEERPVHIEECKTAREAFITSTTKTVLGVRQLDEYQFPEVDRVARKVREFFLQTASGQLSNITGRSPSIK
jgi:branched-chain amino acid aminotransferase